MRSSGSGSVRGIAAAASSASLTPGSGGIASPGFASAERLASPGGLPTSASFMRPRGAGAPQPPSHASPPLGSSLAHAASSATLGSPASTGELPLARNHALATISAKQAASKPTHVTVGIRARPLVAAELEMGEGDAWVYDVSSGTLDEAAAPVGGPSRERAFDFVFPPGTTTAQVYDAMGAPVIACALEGINATLFAVSSGSTSR
jgi:hypothetical protein